MAPLGSIGLFLGKYDSIGEARSSEFRTVKSLCKSLTGHPRRGGEKRTRGRGKWPGRAGSTRRAVTYSDRFCDWHYVTNLSAGRLAAGLQQCG